MSYNFLKGISTELGKKSRGLHWRKAIGQDTFIVAQFLKTKKETKKMLRNKV